VNKQTPHRFRQWRRNVYQLTENWRFRIKRRRMKTFGQTGFTSEAGPVSGELRARSNCSASYLTESNLLFLAQAGLANAEPVLMLPLASVAEVRVDKYLLGRRLVIHLNTGKIHSFEIHTASGMWLDKPAMQSACDFIQSKIKPTGPGP
jgi:hypothetical protein